MEHFNAFMLVLKTNVLAGVIGFGMFVFGHVMWSLMTWSMHPLDYGYMFASIGFPMAVVTFIALMDYEQIYHMAND